MAAELATQADPKRDAYVKFLEIARRKIKLFQARLEKEYTIMLSQPAVARLGSAMEKELMPELERLAELKAGTDEKIAEILKKIEADAPGVLGEVLSGGLGMGGGAVISAWLIGAFGSVSGTSAAGITSGLAALGLGGGMLAGVAMAAVPVAILGAVGWKAYSAYKKNELKKQQMQAIAPAISVLERLLLPFSRYPEFLEEDIQGLKTLIRELKAKKEKLSV